MHTTLIKNAEPISFSKLIIISRVKFFHYRRIDNATIIKLGMQHVFFLEAIEYHRSAYTMYVRKAVPI